MNINICISSSPTQHAEVCAIFVMVDPQVTLWCELNFC